MKYKIEQKKVKEKSSVKFFKNKYNLVDSTYYHGIKFGLSFGIIEEKGLAEYLTDEDKAKFDNAIKERHKCDSLYLSLLEGEE